MCTDNTRPNIAYVVSVPGRFQSNLVIDYWKAAKKTMRYLKRTKDFIHPFSNSNDLHIVGYANLYFASSPDVMKSTLFIYLKWLMVIIHTKVSSRL